MKKKIEVSMVIPFLFLDIKYEKWSVGAEAKDLECIHRVANKKYIRPEKFYNFKQAVKMLMHSVDEYFYVSILGNNIFYYEESYRGVWHNFLLKIVI